MSVVFRLFILINDWFLTNVHIRPMVGRLTMLGPSLSTVAYGLNLSSMCSSANIDRQRQFSFFTATVQLFNFISNFQFIQSFFKDRLQF